MLEAKAKRNAEKMSLVKLALELILAWCALFLIQQNIVVDIWFYGAKETLLGASPDFASFVLFCGTALLIFKQPGTNRTWVDYVWSIQLSFIVTLGYFVNRTGGFAALHAHWYSMLLSIVMFLGTAILSIVLTQYAKRIISRIPNLQVEKPLSSAMNAHPFMMPFAIILIAWLPFALLNYPATVEWDAFKQIEQFLGIQPLKAFWPLASTAIMGSFVFIGNEIAGSYNLGLFSFVLFQTVACAASCAYMVYVLKKVHCPAGFRTIAILIFALVPIFPGYATCVIKDSLYTASLVFMVALSAEIVLCDSSSKKKVVAYFFSCLFVCLLRSNGIYLVIIDFVAVIAVLIVLKKANWLPSKALKSMLLPMVLASTLFFAWNNGLIPSWGLVQPTINDALSIPYMQTARYCKQHPNEVTDFEKQSIDRIMDYNEMIERYDYRYADTIRATQQTLEVGDALPDYFSAWLSQLTKHPETYFASTFSCVYGFLDPFYDDLQAYGGVIYGALNTITSPEDVTLFSRPQALERAHYGLCGYIAASLQFPPTMLLSTAGSAVQVLIYLVLLCLKRRDACMLIVLSPLAVTLLVCIASPTFYLNGARYALPIIFAAPFVVPLCCNRFLRKDESHPSDS